MLQLQRLFWSRVKVLTAALMLVWAAISFVGPWFASEIDVMLPAEGSVSYWMASQGALLLFVAVVGAYVWAMERLETAYLSQIHAVAVGHVDSRDPHEDREPQ